MRPGVAMIQKRGTHWMVLTHDGTKVLGTHPDKESAVKQLQAIEIAKHQGMTGVPKKRTY